MRPEQSRPIEEVLRRVQGEFLEMPGLRLTEAQACRLWGLDTAVCDALLGALVDAKFLFKTRDGAFMKVEQATPVKASIRHALRRSSLKSFPIESLRAGWAAILAIEPITSRPNRLPPSPGGRPSGRRPRPLSIVGQSRSASLFRRATAARLKASRSMSSASEILRGIRQG